jgi:hypothetical protein
LRNLNPAFAIFTSKPNPQTTFIAIPHETDYPTNDAPNRPGGAYRTEFYPTYEHLPVFNEMKKKQSQKAGRQ